LSRNSRDRLRRKQQQPPGDIPVLSDEGEHRRGRDCGSVSLSKRDGPVENATFEAQDERRKNMTASR
jgi:hypothetical protein